MKMIDIQNSRELSLDELKQIEGGCEVLCVVAIGFATGLLLTYLANN